MLEAFLVTYLGPNLTVLFAATAAGCMLFGSVVLCMAAAVRS